MATKEEVQEAIDERKDGFGEPKEEVTESDDKQTETDTVEDSSTSDKTSEESSEEDSTEDDSEDETKDDAEEDTDELEETAPKKSNTQKRIDRLTGEKHQLELRIKSLEEKVNTTDKTERVYSDKELDNAERKAIADNDISLLNDVHKERFKNFERKLVNRYTDDQKKVSEATKANKTEWNGVIERYGPENLPVEYQGNPDFDITNQKSRLFQLAKAYFEDPELSSDYTGKGGMVRAVADAFLEVVKKKTKKKKKSPSEKALERKLAKEKMKGSLASDSSEKGTKVTKTKETGDSVTDFIAERNATKDKALGQVS